VFVPSYTNGSRDESPRLAADWAAEDPRRGVIFT
jgi:hypothetical protein